MKVGSWLPGQAAPAAIDARRTDDETAETATPPLSSDPPELKTLQIEVDGRIGTLTLNRPDALNAISPDADRRAHCRCRVARRPRTDPRADHHRRGAGVLLRR